MNRGNRIVVLVMAAALCASVALSAAEVESVPSPYLENAHRIAPNVYSGAEPHDDAAFKALQELGVKTVISVDGAKPNVELAHKYGLQYIHMPIGYDGVPKERALDLAKAVLEVPGPMYIHCHHGKHRGPAAATTACVISGLIGNAQGLETLKVMGTGTNYKGLWEAVRSAEVADPAALHARHVDYREVSPIPAMAEAMVSVDMRFENLGLAQKADWKAPADHPDVDPPHEALQLREMFVEVTRTPAYAAQDEQFKKWAGSIIADAQELETLLEKGPGDDAAAWKTASNAVLARMKGTCKACHAIHRDTK
jgi:hypothetical protein